MATEIRATVFTVGEVKPHPNADRLELVEALGWQVVCGKGLRKTGEKCVYIQPDSLVPDEWAEKWEVKQYLKGPDHNRVGQIRLRGEPSFGFIVEAADQNWPDGENVAEFYGITKYEPPVRTTCGDAEVAHPLFRKYTDIENLRNFPNVFTVGEEVVATEKIHGTNCRVGMIDGVPMAGSMELRRKMPETEEAKKSNTYWFPWTLDSVGLMLNVLGAGFKQVILFGEVYGVQKGYNYDVTPGKVGFRAFDLMIDGKWLDHDVFMEKCAKYGVETAPVLYLGPFSLQAIKQVSDGPTTIGDGNIREGVVVRPIKERHHPQVGRLVMKYVGDDYLLSKHPDAKDV